MIFINHLDDMPCLKAGDQYVTTDKSNVSKPVFHVETHNGEQLVDDKAFKSLGKAVEFAIQREREAYASGT